MLTEEEKIFIRDIFFKTDFTKENLKLRERECKKDEMPFWKTLYNFVFQYRTTAIKEDDLLIDNWLYEVVPSCTYPKKPYEKFCCVFCENQYARTGYIVRHYKEKHSNQMPQNIFGKEEFKCDFCDVKFFRKENYKLHLESIKHKISIDPTYVPEEKETTVNHNKAKRQNEIELWESKRPKKLKQDSESHNNDSTKEDNSAKFLSDEDLINDKIISNRKTLILNYKKLGLSDSESFSKDEDSKKEEKSDFFEEIKSFQETINSEENETNQNNSVEHNDFISEINEEQKKDEHDLNNHSEDYLSQKIKKSLSFQNL
jgi:hypothetical protein